MAAMPSMLYGTAWKAGQTTELVVKAIRNGFKGVDTACQPKHYSQALVGQALKQLEAEHGIPRSSLFIQTKFTSLDGQDLKKPLPYDPKATLPEMVRQSLATSLKELGTTYIDSLVLHSPMRTREETLAVWTEFEKFVEAKQVRQLGISNIYDPVELRWAFETFKIKPAVIQNRFYDATEFDLEILQLCAQFKASYQSFWTLTANPQLLKSAQLKAYTDSLSQPFTPAQSLYHWLMSTTHFGEAGQIVPLSGTKSDQHMLEDVAVQNLVEQERSGVVRVSEATLSAARALEAAVWGPG